MFDRTFHSVHPDMMEGASNQALRNRHLVDGLFRRGEIVLTYSHDERFIVGGAVPDGGGLALPRLSEPPSAAGSALLDRRELAIVNIGRAPGRILADGIETRLDRYEVLYVPKGTQDVQFLGDGARFYLLSVPAHAAHPMRRIAPSDAGTLMRGSPEQANARTIHQMIVPGRCASAGLCLGLTRLHPGSVWNTMPPHVHGRRNEIYLYFDMGEEDRVFHFMGLPAALRHIVVANEQAVMSPPWSVHMGAGTRAYSFIWAMAGENQDYDDMQLCGVGELR